MDEIALITGANGGMGKATAIELARRGATVVMVARDRDRGEQARQEVIKAAGRDSVQLMIADLSVQASLRTLAGRYMASYPRLDLLINNAALHVAQRTVTPDGLETMFATNHLGYFLLTELLLESLRAAPAARVLNITAPSTVKLNFDDLQGEQQFRSLQAFGATKTANLLFTFKLARRLEGTPISANAVHPGIVRSGLMRESNVFLRTLTRVMGKPAALAGHDIADLGLSPEFAGQTGRFFKHGHEIKPPPYTLDPAIQVRLWTVSEQLTSIAP